MIPKAVLFTPIVLFQFSFAYKPVFIIHGILSDNFTMLPMVYRIQELHPGTIVYATDRFGGFSSLRPMWHQVLEIGSDVVKVMKDHPEGIHLIGYSQGGLIARGILEHFSDHNVNTFVSLSSPQCGQYGTQFLHLFFPSLTCETAFELFYSRIGQHTSVGNYWNDPYHQQLFYEYSVFLPYLNNMIVSNFTEVFKQGITKLRKMVLIGGPDDGVITPWQSSHFGSFDEKEQVVEMVDQPFFKNDSFGLKTLYQQNKIITTVLANNSHFDWHTNLTVIDNYIIPHLD